MLCVCVWPPGSSVKEQSSPLLRNAEVSTNREGVSHVSVKDCMITFFWLLEENRAWRLCPALRLILWLSKRSVTHCPAGSQIFHQLLNECIYTAEIYHVLLCNYFINELEHVEAEMSLKCLWYLVFWIRMEKCPRVKILCNAIFSLFSSFLKTPSFVRIFSAERAVSSLFVCLFCFVPAFCRFYPPFFFIRPSAWISPVAGWLELLTW